jgi:hypothetical protein
VIGFGDHYLGGRSGQGNALLIDQIHEPTEWVPRRTAPPVLAGTWVTHLFGGSAGREGTALQMSGGLSDVVARALQRLLPRQGWWMRPRRAKRVQHAVRPCAYRDLRLNLWAYVSLTNSMSSSSGVLRPQPLATKRACRWSSIVREARPSAVSDSISASSVASR